MKQLYVLLAAGFLASCGSSKSTNDKNTTETTGTSQNPQEVEVVEDLVPTTRPVYHGSETIYTDLIHTRLDVRFDWEKAYLYGKATIQAKPHFYTTDSLVLDAKGMTINHVMMNGKRVQHRYSNDRLVVQLDKKYTRDDRYEVIIDYVSRPNERETGGSSAITSDKGLYFINHDGSEGKKMPQIWTQGETEASSVWFPTIDAPNVKTAQEIFMTVDQKYVTLSNGKFIGSTKNADGTRTDHWKQELPHAPYLFMMGVGEFKVVNDTYTRPDGSTMEVKYYVEPEWEQYADDIFGKTPKMIGYFSKLLGVEYPWDKYHQIVVRDYVSGAMENTGAVIFGDFVYKTDRELIDENSESIIAHELFHHWFGDYVTCESWSNLPLNESFANYSQYLWDEFEYGVDQADYYAEEEADGYYQTAQMGGTHDLIWFDYDEREQMFDGHSYNKGGRILHMLRNYIGDEAFFKGMNVYLTTNKFKPAEFHQLRLAFEEVTGEDLNWFFNQWFLGSNHPVLEINQQLVGQEVMVTIEQKQDLKTTPLYKLPMKVAVVDDAGTHVHSIVLDELEQSFTFPVTGELKTVIPDFQQMLLAKVTENKPQEQFIAQYHAGNRWRARDRALRFGTKKMDSLSQQLILDALHDDFWSIRILAIERAGRLKGGFQAMASDIIATIAMKDEHSSVRAAALSYLENAGQEDLSTLMTTIIEHDSSYLVVGSALRILAKANPSKAMEIAKGLEKEPSSSMMMGIASMYSQFGKAEQFTFYTELFNSGKLVGFDELGAMNAFSVYLGRQELDQWEEALPYYQEFKSKGGHYMQMFLPQNIKYLLKGIESHMSNLEMEIAEAREAGNEAGAKQKESEYNRWMALRTGYSALLDN